MPEGKKAKDKQEAVHGTVQTQVVQAPPDPCPAWPDNPTPKSAHQSGESMKLRPERPRACPQISTNQYWGYPLDYAQLLLQHQPRIHSKLIS